MPLQSGEVNQDIKLEFLSREVVAVKIILTNTKEKIHGISKIKIVQPKYLSNLACL